MSDGPLLERAQAWMETIHPHAEHLRRTLDYARALDPAASEALEIAAATHDVERAFPDPEHDWDTAAAWNDPEYNRWHQDRCADMIATWLHEQEASPELVEQVESLVRVHELGGWREADVLQAADSLSFLDCMTPLAIGWVTSGRAPRGQAEAKLRHSLERISPELPEARELAEPMLDRALAELDAAARKVEAA